MITRPIPKSGEKLPVIGLGTWQTFDVGNDVAALARLTEVLRLLFDGGGKVIDSSPMYGRAEAVVGDLLDHTLDPLGGRDVSGDECVRVQFLRNVPPGRGHMCPRCP